MKPLITLAFTIFVLMFVSCGSDKDDKGDKNNSQCSTTCKNWEVCQNDKCELKPGMCNNDDDCKNNTDNKTICDIQNHTCMEKQITCNEEKAPSNFKLPKDECGELTACDDSYDCAENQRCENLYNEENEFTRACCIEGPRGCKKTGETCETEFDCESGLCIGRNEGTKYCSKKCDPENNDCPEPITECKDLYIMHACVAKAED